MFMVHRDLETNFRFVYRESIGIGKQKSIIINHFLSLPVHVTLIRASLLENVVLVSV